MFSNVTMLLSFSIYLLFSLFILWKFGRSATQDKAMSFWVAPHSAGPYVAAFAAGASDMSSWLVLALPASVYLWGGQDIFLCLGLVLGAYCSWTFLAPHLIRIYKEDLQSESFIQVLVSAVSLGPDRMLRKVITVVIIFFTCIYIAAGLSAIAKILSVGFSFSPLTGLCLGAIFLMLASLLGGAAGLNALEIVQGLLMMFLLLILFFYFGGKNISFYSQFGGVLADSIEKDYGQTLSISRVVHDLSWGLGYFGIPHILTRMSVISRKKDIPKARFVLVSWMIISLLCAFFLGFIGRFYYPSLSDHELVIPFFLLDTSVTFAGLGFALMIGACLCAGCAQLYSSSSSLSEDLLSGKCSRHWSIFILILCSLLLSLIFKKGIFELVDLGWAGLSTTFSPYIFLLLSGRRITTSSMLPCIVLNFIVVNILFVSDTLNVFGTMLPSMALHTALVFLLSTSSSNNQVQE